MTEFLVRGRSGLQFSIHATEAEAQPWADKVGGTVEPYVPVHSHKYDWLTDIS